MFSQRRNASLIPKSVSRIGNEIGIFGVVKSPCPEKTHLCLLCEDDKFCDEPKKAVWRLNRGSTYHTLHLFHIYCLIASYVEARKGGPSLPVPIVICTNHVSFENALRRL
jgi:hypothetical protein